MSQRCTAITRSGTRCRNKQHGPLCPVHSPYARKKRPTINYKAYLASPTWKLRRQAYIDSRFTSNDCYCCGRKYQPGFNLHHLTYERLGCERLNDLRMVCAPCHEEIHKLAKRIKNIALATHKIRAKNGLPMSGIRTKLPKR